jgi:hypothetical protein
MIQHPPANRPTPTDRIEAALNALLENRDGGERPH